MSMGRIKLVYRAANDVLAECYAVGADGVEVPLPIKGVIENSEAHRPDRPAEVLISMHRMHVDHVRPE